MVWVCTSDQFDQPEIVGHLNALKEWMGEQHDCEHFTENVTSDKYVHISTTDDKGHGYDIYCHKITHSLEGLPVVLKEPPKEYEMQIY